jgi:hypothetical protein
MCPHRVTSEADIIVRLHLGKLLISVEELKYYYALTHKIIEGLSSTKYLL